MLKKILLLSLLTISLFGNINWLNYGEAIVKAKKECKPIFLVVYDKKCQACISLFHNISKTPQIIKAINQYTPAIITAQKAYAQYGAKIASTPTILMMDNKREEMLNPIIGSPKDGAEFLRYINLGIEAMKNTSTCYKE